MSIGSISTTYTSPIVYQMRSVAQKGEDEAQESRTQQISQTKSDSVRPVDGLSMNAEEKGETHVNNAAIKMAAASGALSITKAPVKTSASSDNKETAIPTKPDNQELQKQAMISKLGNYQSMNQAGKSNQGVMAGSFDQKA